MSNVQSWSFRTGVMFALLVSLAAMCGAGGIDGTLADFDGHKHGHLVLLTDGDTVVAHAETNAEGAFAFADVAPGTYTVRMISYWYGMVERQVTVSDEPVALELQLDSDAVTLAAGWDDHLNADYSVTGNVRPVLPGAQRVEPGFVGRGALQTTLMYSFSEATKLVNAQEGTVDFWVLVPDSDATFTVMQIHEGSEGLNWVIGWGRFFFEVNGTNENGHYVTDAARFVIASHKGKVIHVTSTYNIPENRVRVYVNGQLVNDRLRRVNGPQGWEDIDHNTSPPPMKRVGDELFIGTSRSGSPTTRLITPLDQLSIRSRELSPEEVRADYERKAEFRAIVESLLSAASDTDS